MRIHVRDAWYRAPLLDVSSSGVRFGSADLPALGEHVTLKLRVPAHAFDLSGSVMRQSRETAVALDPLSRSQQLALNAAILEAEPGSALVTILLMVQDPALQLAIGRALRERGYRVLSRVTPLDVVRQFVDDGAGIQAVIVAANLRDRAGQAVLEYLASERPWVRRGLFDGEGSATQIDADFVLLDPRAAGRMIDEVVDEARVA